MPVDPGTTFPIFSGALASNLIVGPYSSQLAAGLANGLFQYLTISVSVNSIDAGTLGVGTGNGFSLILSQGVILGVLEPMLLGHGIFGLFSPSMANAIAMGVSVSMLGAQIITTNPTVGTGAGKVQLVPTATGGLVFAAALKEVGLTGVGSDSLGLAIGDPLDSVIATTVGVIAIAGSPSNVPSSGVGTGRLI